MAQTRRKFDAEFRAGAVRIVTETGKPIAQVAWDNMEINEGTLGNWVAKDRTARSGNGTGGLSEDERAREVYYLLNPGAPPTKGGGSRVRRAGPRPARTSLPQAGQGTQGQGARPSGRPRQRRRP